MDNNLKNEIEAWGIPNISELNGKNIKLIFDSNIINKKKDNFYELHCEKGSVKFCLYDFDNNKEIFIMDFYEPSHSMLRITNDLPNIKLELINVNDPTLRKKGIASYYIEKLKEYAIKHKYSYIKVTVNPNADIFKGQCKNNSLDRKELRKFYKNKSTKDMPIKITNI